MRDFIWIPVKSAREHQRDQIIAEVCKKHGLLRSEVFMRRRIQPVVLARHEVMARLHTELDMGLSQIARLFGGMHHTTVLHGVRAHQQRTRGRLAA